MAEPERRDPGAVGAGWRKSHAGTERIVAETLACGEENRKLLLLSERTDYIMAIATALAEQVPNLFLLHGRLNARQRSANLPTQCRNACGSADCGAIGRWGMG